MEADWILTNAVVWTGEVSGGVGRRSEEGWARREPIDAIALREGRIIAVASEDELAPLKGAHTATLSLEGGFVAPGFVDAHLHLLAGGLQLSRVDLRGVGSPEEFIRRVADRTRNTPPGSWILGGDWNEEDWGGGLPTREWLDRAAPDHPVFLHRADLHSEVANSRALQLAGIGDQTPDPEFGRIDRCPDSGEVTGIVRERAIRMVTDVIPPPTDHQRWAALRGAALHALAQGVTQVHDMGALLSREESWRSFELLRALRAEGRLPLRVVAALPMEDWPEVADLVHREGHGDERLRWGMVKAFVDGSLGSATAWFHEPYTDDPENRGGVATDPDRLRSDLVGAVSAGLQPAVHAIGDRANDWILDAYESLGRAHPGPDLRLRIEHAQHLTPEAIRRFASDGPIASVQPLHLVEDGRSVARKLGPERETGAFAFGRLLRAGARIAFGSDWTVAPVDPIAAIQAAVVRSVAFDQGGRRRTWLPDERMSVGGALRAHTLGGAEAGFMDRDTGTLEPGKRADLVVLSANPFTVDPDHLTRDVQVEMTFVDGVLAYRRERDRGE